MKGRLQWLIVDVLRLVVAALLAATLVVLTVLGADQEVVAACARLVRGALGLGVGL